MESKVETFLVLRHGSIAKAYIDYVVNGLVGGKDHYTFTEAEEEVLKRYHHEQCMKIRQYKEWYDAGQPRRVR